MRTSVFATISAGLLAFGGAAHATTVSDAAGDFASTYIGPKQADLDVISFSVNYNAGSQSFLLTSVMNGAIDASLPGFYAIGVNTGTGPNSFASIGLDGVKFNTVIAVQKAGTATVGGNSLPAGDVTIDGAKLTVILPLSLLPASTGFMPMDYGFNIWPRSGAGGIEVISDFAPDNATVSANGVSGVPEPATWASMVIGFGFCGAALRTRRKFALG